SLLQIRSASPGFSTDNVLVTTIDFISAGYSPERARLFEDELIDRLQSVSGIVSAVFTRGMPFTYSADSSPPGLVDGDDAPADQLPLIEYNEVGPAYFKTTGVPILSGREFVREDDQNSASVAVINEAMSTQFWPRENPVGKRFLIKG